MMMRMIAIVVVVVVVVVVIVIVVVVVVVVVVVIVIVVSFRRESLCDGRLDEKWAWQPFSIGQDGKNMKEMLLLLT